MALSPPQDPEFRVISQQMGNVAPRQAGQELESTFQGACAAMCYGGRREVVMEATSTGPPSSRGGHQLHVRMVSDGLPWSEPWKLLLA